MTDKAEQIPELKPCPFCGGEAKIVIRGFSNSPIECKKCQAQTLGKGAWNTRTASPPADGDMAKASRALDELCVKAWAYCDLNDCTLDPEYEETIRAALQGFGHVCTDDCGGTINARHCQITQERAQHPVEVERLDEALKGVWIDSKLRAILADNDGKIEKVLKAARLYAQGHSKAETVDVEALKREVMEQWFDGPADICAGKHDIEWAIDHITANYDIRKKGV